MRTKDCARCGLRSISYENESDYQDKLERYEWSHEEDGPVCAICNGNAKEGEWRTIGVKNKPPARLMVGVPGPIAERMARHLKTLRESAPKGYRLSMGALVGIILEEYLDRVKMEGRE